MVASSTSVCMCSQGLKAQLNAVDFKATREKEVGTKGT